MAEIFFEVIRSKWVLNGSEGWKTLFFTQFNDFWVFWRHLWDHKCKKWPKQVIFSLPDFFQMTYRVDIYCFWLIVWSKSAIDWLSARSASTLIKPRAIWVLNFIRANGRWRTLVFFNKKLLNNVYENNHLIQNGWCPLVDIGQVTLLILIDSIQPLFWFLLGNIRHFCSFVLVWKIKILFVHSRKGMLEVLWNGCQNFENTI